MVGENKFISYGDRLGSISVEHTDEDKPFRLELVGTYGDNRSAIYITEQDLINTIILLVSMLEVK